MKYCYEHDLGILWNWLADNFTAFFEPLATLTATFIGAYLAFKYQRHLEQKKEIVSKIQAGNLVLFHMSANASWLYTTKVQLIDPYRDHPARMLTILPELHPGPEMTFDIESIDFLLGSKDANFLGELLVEKRRFEQAVLLQKIRSEYYIKEVYPLIERAGVRHGQGVDEVQMKQILGEVKWFMLESMTNHYIEQVDATLESHMKFAPKLREAFRSVFPSGKFINFSLIPEEELNKNSR